jgi:4-amino-4-deoxy-L-arabinose transferase-like glycosyltransferase
VLDRYKQYIPLVYFLITGILVFIHNGNISLWDQDEAAYAGFAKGMLSSGNWLIPDFMWSEIHRKTPLHFWNIALSYVVFGINEFSVRFPSALFLLLTYIFIYKAGTPLLGKRAAFIGTVVLSTSLFIPSLAKVSVTDATLLFFSTVCAFAMINIVQQKSIKWTLAFWAAFAMALLTKGPPIILFTGVFAIILFCLHPNRKNLFSMHPWFFLPIACLPLFIWGYLVNQKDGGAFITWLIDWYILKRVNSSVLGQTGPPGTHLISMFVFFIPYFMFLPKAFWKALSSTFMKDKNLNFLLSAWFISGWFIYEWSPSKLPSYVIVAHVPLAIFIAKELLNYTASRTLPAKGLIIAHFTLILLIYLAFIVAPQLLHFTMTMKISFALAAGVLITLTIITIKKLRSGNFRPLLVANFVFQLLVWGFLLPIADGLKNGSKRIAEFVIENAADNSIVLIANTQGHPPSLPFYLGLNFRHVREEGDYEKLSASLQSTYPHVLILNREQRDFVASRKPEQVFTEIKSMMTDRDESAQYYIAINRGAEK